ncbi:MAG TPA: tetratricopeptide repeat protein, partial [Clostridia bacterium]|nr:tetratricopeptide repeat protein [Clostridia bacterium]
MALILALGMPSAAQAQTAQGKATKKRTSAPNPNAVAMQEAEQAMEARDFATAESKLKSVLAEHPENYRAWFDLGYVYHSTDRTPLAIDAYRKSVKAQPGVLEPTLNLG